MVANALVRFIQMAAPVIHQSIVRTLANNITFQRLAWHGTETAKKAAKEGAEAVKQSDAYRTAQYKAMEKMSQLRQSEAYKEIDASHAARTARQIKDKVLSELRQTRLK